MVRDIGSVQRVHSTLRDLCRKRRGCGISGHARCPGTLRKAPHDRLKVLVIPLAVYLTIADMLVNLGGPSGREDELADGFL